MANSIEWRWLSMLTPEIGRGFLRTLVDIQGLALYDSHCVRIKRTVLQVTQNLVVAKYEDIRAADTNLTRLGDFAMMVPFLKCKRQRKFPRFCIYPGETIFFRSDPVGFALFITVYQIEPTSDERAENTTGYHANDDGEPVILMQ